VIRLGRRGIEGLMRGGEMMEIVKIGDRSEIIPKSLVEVVEDESESWGVTGPVSSTEEVYKALFVVSSISHYDERMIYDLKGQKSYRVSVESKEIRLDASHPVGATRHSDHIFQYAYLSEVVSFHDIKEQFEKAGYKFVDLG